MRDRIPTDGIGHENWTPPEVPVARHELFPDPVPSDAHDAHVPPNDEWDRPEHYGGEENPFEPIKIIEHYELGFNLGNTLKYILRLGKKKGEPEMKDLKKAYTYLGFEIRRREREGDS
jgi:hypothetical protein